MKGYLLAIMLFSGFYTLYAQNGYWEEAEGPEGGDLTILPTLTNKVYGFIFSHYNLLTYRSIDYGKNWDVLPITEIDSLDLGERLRIGVSGIFFNIVFYKNGASSFQKLYISHDEGITWSLQNSDLPISDIKEVHTGFLIGGNAITGPLFQSFDNGITWQQANISSAFASSSVFSAKNTSDGKVMLTNSQGDFAYSSNSGVSWNEGHLPFNIPYGNISNAGTLFTHSGPALYRSTNLGVTWDTITFNLEQLSGIMNLNNGQILLSSKSNLFVSNDEGESWTLLPQGLEQANGFLINHPLSNGVILAKRKLSVFRSTDNGNNWTFSTYGIRQAAVKQLAFIGDSTQLAVTEDALWKTTNSGESWDRILPETSSATLPQKHPLAILNADTFAVAIGLNIWETKDGGQSFNKDTLVDKLSRRDVFAAAGAYLFCTGQGGILRSNGIDGLWSNIVDSAALHALVEHPSGDLYALWKYNNAPQNYTFCRSSDAGVSWEEITNLAFAGNGQWGLRIALDGKIYVTGFQNAVNLMAISDDDGTTWIYNTIPTFYSYGWQFAINNIGRIFTQTHSLDVLIFTSADDGESWYFLPPYNIDETYLNGLEIAPSGQLYVMPGRGTMYRTVNSTEQGAYIRGQVLRDVDQDCATPDAQNPLKNWIIELDGGAQNYFNKTNEVGRYTFFVDTGSYSIKALEPQQFWWSLCDSAQIIKATELTNSDTANFIALSLANCPLISVNVAAPQLRRCFNNYVYLEYCNQGTEPADSAWIDVILDPFLSLINSDQPHEILGNNTIRFFIGDVPSGECDQFQLTVYVNCDSTVIGQTHCIYAHGFPDTLGTLVPNWSGATIEASVTCQDTTLKFRLENTGDAHSEILEYIIIEDDVVLLTGQKGYEVAEDLILDFPANGKTWRIESEQEPGHPFSTLALAFTEGCGGFNSLGYINQYPVNGTQPSWHRICVENIGSYDPNDKQGFPYGVGDAHNIRPGQEIDYLIRFQNTGTDTAFTVVIKDTLSPFLDPSSIRPGASSHPYTWDLSGQGVVSFSFNNIMLPDSNVNEPASHGFVQFTINPYPTIPLGSVIENEAAIYFDFNIPVFTNTTWHTIEKSPSTSTLLPEPITVEHGLEVWPNPFRERTNIRLKQKKSGMMFLKIYDNKGSLVVQKTAFSSDFELTAKHLPSGLYWAEIRNEKGELLGNGKLIKE